MSARARLALILALLFAGLALAAYAATGGSPTAGGAPSLVSYQGEVRLAEYSGPTVPFSGVGHFKFAVVNAAGDVVYWSNDGTPAGEPAAAVPLDVSQGLFSVLLGDTGLPGMTDPLAADVFGEPERYLRVWFATEPGGPFSLLGPDTRIAAVPYALQAQEAADADTVDGLHAADLETHYQNVVVVARSGGDHTGVQAAIDSITDAAADNAYLVWVAPGVYVEQVTLKPHVHLQGAGQEATVITSNASSSTSPPTEATLTLAGDSSLRDVTVGNEGTGANNVALRATGGATQVLVADVTVRALGAGTDNAAIYVGGGGTGVTLQRVTALAENGTGDNVALANDDGAAAVTLHGGSFTARGGTDALGIRNDGSGATLDAEGVTALGEGGTIQSSGLYNTQAATLRLGSFTGRQGTKAEGICNAGASARLEAEGVSALGEGSLSNYSRGLDNSSGAVALLRGGSFTGREGTYAHGIHSAGSGTELDAEGVTALGENANDNYGLHNYDAAVTRVRTGSFTGRGGASAAGIHNEGTGTSLEAEGIAAVGEEGAANNLGLYNYLGAAATLRGGSFTGRGGSDGVGIYNWGSGSSLEAGDVTALGEGGSMRNWGLYNQEAATLHGGSFTGRGGDTAKGIYNGYGYAVLEATAIAARAENGISYNCGFQNEIGAAATLVACSVSAVSDNATSDNYGLDNDATVTLLDGSYTARGGDFPRGIRNAGGSATMEATGITVLGEGGASGSFGLINGVGAAATLRGGAFTGLDGGGNAGGISNTGSGTTLEATGIAALGQGGSLDNYGLYHADTAVARLHGGSFAAREGTKALGIYVWELGTELEAEGVTALGESGSTNYGLYSYRGTLSLCSSRLLGDAGTALDQYGGTAYLGVSQLDGGATLAGGGSLTCFQVYDANFAAYTCP